MRYIVYKQPLSLDRFFLHDVPVTEAVTAKLEYAFVMVNLNRFQQIVAVYTFLAQSDQAKVQFLLKLSAILRSSNYFEIKNHDNH